MNLLDVKNLDVSYGRKSLLTNISFSVKENEFIGILGINGAGKTSLLKSILNLIPAKTGQILIKGKDRSLWDRQELASTLSYLEQNKDVAWPILAEAVVELGLYPCKQKKLSQIEETMKELDCFHLAKRPIDQLSGGEKTLILLARALVMNPDLIFMDEPISNLDPKHELHIMSFLAKLANKNKSVITVLHSLPLAAQFCTRIIMLHENKIFIDGKPEDVLTYDTLKKVYDIDVLVEKKNGKTFISPTISL